MNEERWVGDGKERKRRRRFAVKIYIGSQKCGEKGKFFFRVGWLVGNISQTLDIATFLCSSYVRIRSVAPGCGFFIWHFMA